MFIGSEHTDWRSAVIYTFVEHNPDAKVGMTKHGACDMIYKPEHITDLESGAIVAATVRYGNEGDTKNLTSRILAAGSTLARVCGDPQQEKVLRSLTADEGYFSIEEICGLQGESIRTVIGDPHATQRRKDKQSALVKQNPTNDRRAVKSASGKALLRKRGEHIERSFAHVLDHGGLRRTTLRGKLNLTKRQLAAALAFDLSLLMRKLTGHGTPKQWLAGALRAFFCYIRSVIGALLRSTRPYEGRRTDFYPNRHFHNPGTELGSLFIISP
jgi:transposase